MIRRVLLLLVFMTLSFACDTTNNQPSVSKGYYEEDEMISEMTTPVMESKKSYQNNDTKEIIPQKLIKTAYLTFETESLEKTYQNIITAIKANKGYVQNDNTTKSYDRITRNLLIRIPNLGFQPLVDTIVDNVKVLDRKDINSKDVTEEFVDLEARLKAKRKLEERYLQLLTKAKTVGDMLDIERQISKIREEIEAKQGRLKYLQNQVSYSTVHVSFYELIPVTNAPSQTYGSRLWRAVQGGFNGIGNFFIGLVYVWPFILIGVLTGLYIRYRIRKKRNKNQ